MTSNTRTLKARSTTSAFKHALVITVAALSLLGFRASRLVAFASTCRVPDADAFVFRSYIRELVASQNLDRIEVRNALGLKAMDSTRVNFVSDNRVCDKVGQGINTKLETFNLDRELYVVRVGTDYAAQDPGHPSGEWWPTITMDSKYKFKGAVLAP